MRLSQPLSIEKQCCVEALNGNQRRQLEDHSTRWQQKIVHHFAENVIHSGRDSAGSDGGEIMDDIEDAGEKQPKTDLIDDAETEKILLNPMAKARSLSKGDEAEEIIGYAENKTQ